ncbi:MAG: Flp pilus assembly complex ATPase component TadA [Planctomycetes bacterium]|nr:Flp pilus assembly complex ATPase component TadA [Planctomycetota bacterium]MCB9902994.1 Flp pilus assembly complex ATPase component TadA [Planctomycetota bacterium]
MVTLKGRLGDRLIEKGRLTEAQLEVALGEQKRAHRALGEILVSLAFCTHEDILELLAEDMGLPFLREQDVQVDPLIASTLDADFVRETQSFPYSLVDGTLRIVMVSPDDPHCVARVRERFPYPLDVAITSERVIKSLTRGHLESAESVVAKIFQELQALHADEHVDYPVEALTEAVLLDGINRGATDIHVEPEERICRIRYRIDGVLHTGENLPQGVTAAVVSRIKIMSSLDISERRRPQDGRLSMLVGDHQIDMRVSVMPCTYGENVVLRILDRSGGCMKLGSLGISSQYQRLLQRIIQRPHGLFLVTGPTGSGKTTTLYSMLSMIDATERNVATVEDPVEYRMPLLRQSQVDPSIGFNFHSGLRALLRQDPDVILIGEIRDQETADMAIKASMTGHLVLSTLHTNSALGVIPRLADIGIEPFMIEDSLIGALGQRLVRRVCDSCAQLVPPTDVELRWLGREVEHLRRGAGCDRCNGSGLAGRTVLAELFVPDDSMADALRTGSGLGTLQQLAKQQGFQSLEDDGRRLVSAGVTTMEEILRVNASHRLTLEERGDV